MLLYTAELRDNEASQQVESTQLAAAEIERLAEDKQRLAEHLQQEVQPFLLCFLAFPLLYHPLSHMNCAYLQFSIIQVSPYNVQYNAVATYQAYCPHVSVLQSVALPFF